MNTLRITNANMVLAFAVFCGAAVVPASGQGLPVQWTAWSSATAGTPGSATGALSPGGLGVTYSGDNFGLNSDPVIWLPTSTFVGPTIANAPPAGSNGIKLKGGTPNVNTITFAGPVSNPVLSIVSLGQPALQAAFNFATTPFTIIACGPSADYGGVCITQTANNVLGNEGSGTIQFAGTFTSISWTNPIFEDFYVFTVGVPVPQQYSQTSYAAGLNIGDSVIDITNVGTLGAGLNAGTSASTTGALCANVYTFSPDEQLISCCSCPVTPNGLVSLSAKADLINNTLTPATPVSIVVKVVATVPVGGSCVNSAAALTTATLAPGIKAFGTTVHATPVAGTFGVTERPFSPDTLSAGELSRLGNLCNFIVANGSGFGICNSCRLGGLGSARQ